MSAFAWAGVLVFGGLAAIARFLLDTAVSQRVGRGFPVGTLAINLSGAFVLGLLTGIGTSGVLSVLAGTATIGSFTTFSTWMLETHRLVEDGERRNATVNVLASLVVGVLAAGAGRAIGGQL